MLAIRMQRTGRKGHAMFRLIVQDARRTPTSGKVVAFLGSYDPHSKKTILNKQKAAFYLEHGAQPSPRIIRIFKEEKIKLPVWAEGLKTKEGAVKNPDKRRSTAPKSAEPEQSAAEEAVSEPAAAAEATADVSEEPITATEEVASEPEPEQTA